MLLLHESQGSSSKQSNQPNASQWHLGEQAVPVAVQLFTFIRTAGLH